MSKEQVILDYYGVEAQRDLLQEECAELIQAVSKLRRYGEQEKYMVNFIEEMADVSILLEQMKISFNSNQEALFEKITNRKIVREFDRMREAEGKRLDEFFYGAE